MRRRAWGKVMLVLFGALMLAMPVWQLASLAETKHGEEDGAELLYQVSAFQMDLLGSALNEAGRIKTTEQLNEWKRAAYAAEYTHERLTIAVGKTDLSQLDSLQLLLQWIMRVQIGGDRPLRQDELKTMQETSKAFAPLLDSYGKLMGSGGKVIPSVLTELEEADRGVAKLLKEKTK